jgi:hypothetical protein
VFKSHSIRHLADGPLSGADLSPVSGFGASSFSTTSLSAFSHTLETFSPKSWAFLRSSAGTLMLVTFFEKQKALAQIARMLIFAVIVFPHIGLPCKQDLSQ